jgi:hypothetical protein
MQHSLNSIFSLFFPSDKKPVTIESTCVVAVIEKKEIEKKASSFCTNNNIPLYTLYEYISHLYRKYIQLFFGLNGFIDFGCVFT